MAADGPVDPERVPSAVRAFAPAKINLYLHVVGRRPDGYHLLDSLIAFADIGDWVTARPADGLSLTIEGPEAGSLTDQTADNLVLRAARLLAEAMPQPPPGAALHLHKVLPVSSGIGGGSSDAAAALRALCRLWRYRPEPPHLAALALRLGADTPACLLGAPVWVGGIGDMLDPAPGMPNAGILLVNPRIALSTPAVFKARHGDFSEPGRFATMPADVASLATALAGHRNDLTAAACSVVPEIGRILETLSTLPGGALARMSGSGATCFALFRDRNAAQDAAAMVRQARPAWWVAAGALTIAPPPIHT
ncbi:MAG: 4-(cytidine 5'-diphospho)-2-C-methyl-D-erythritol kinase [Alphaproteobacteria bacterium]|nr:4-(cytidine 5'-diphospho)-2-C-methyl-D-erythritol kinase [Alphaproteobacteria bacterium]